MTENCVYVKLFFGNELNASLCYDRKKSSLVSYVKGNYQVYSLGLDGSEFMSHCEVSLTNLSVDETDLEECRGLEKCYECSEGDRVILFKCCMSFVIRMRWGLSSKCGEFLHQRVVSFFLEGGEFKNKDYVEFD